MNKQSTRYFSSKQEKSVAKAVGGVKTANSGAMLFNKGDVLSDLFCIECKTRMKPQDSITIKRDWIYKNREEAFSMGKPYSALCFNFGDIHLSENFYIIDEKLFLKLNSFLKEENNI